MDDTLADCVRQIIGEDPNISEIRMFGGLCFMLNGNMLAGVMKDGSFLVRVGDEGHDAALKRPGAASMSMGGRTMKGFITVDPIVLENGPLREWIAYATDFVGRMPVKTPKPSKKSQPR